MHLPKTTLHLECVASTRPAFASQVALAHVFPLTVPVLITAGIAASKLVCFVASLRGTNAVPFKRLLLGPSRIGVQGSSSSQEST